MASIVWSDVTDVAPELATGVTAGFQTKILAHVNRVVSTRAFGGEESPTLTLARSYLAAHFASRVGPKRGKVGPVASQSEGGVSQSFANGAPPSTSELATTSYGQDFLSLVRSSPYARAGFVTGDCG